MTEEPSYDGGDIVGDGKGKDAARRTLMDAGDVTQSANEAQTVSEKKEVGFLLQEAASPHRTARTEGGIEGEAVIRSISNVQGIITVVLGDPGSFCFRRETRQPMFGIKSELGRDVSDFFGTVTTEDVDMKACMTKIFYFLNRFAPELVTETEADQGPTRADKAGICTLSALETPCGALFIGKCQTVADNLAHFASRRTVAGAKGIKETAADGVEIACDEGA